MANTETNAQLAAAPTKWKLYEAFSKNKYIPGSVHDQVVHYCLEVVWAEPWAG